MIHQVCACSEDVDKLRRITDLQLCLLELAAHQPLVSSAGNSLESLLESHLQPTFGDRASQVAKWVVGKPTFTANLGTFSLHGDQAMKLAFVQGIRHDVDLLFHPDPRRFRLAITKASPAWQRAAGDFLRHFYKIWGAPFELQHAGFPSYLFASPPNSDASYSRWDFITRFCEENGRLYLCAICDATAYQTRVDKRAYTSIEHFFPKSIYPHLAMHPYNLIPICTFCNSIAGDKDFLAFCGDDLGITELLLPYQENRPGLSELAYIEVRPRDDSSGQNGHPQHPLEIRFRPAVGQDSQRLIASFDKAYGVEKRWNNDLDQIDEHVFRRLCQFLLGDIQMGNALEDVDFVLGRIELLMALTSKENLGRDPFGFAAIWLLKYHADSIRREGDEAPIYRALKDWAADQQGTWQELRDHVHEINSRVPG